MAEVESPVEDQAAQGLAYRLRLLQAELADRPPQQRQERLVVEIQQSTANLPAAQKGAVLDRLTRYFPAWGDVPKPASGSGDAKPATNEPPPNLPIEVLVKQLQDYVAANPAAKPKLQRMFGDPAAPPPVPAVPEAAVRKVVERLTRGDKAVPDKGQVDVARLLEVMASMVDVLAFVDSHVWNVWRAITKSGVQPQSLNDLILKYVTTADAALAQREAAEHLLPHMNRLRQRLNIVTATLRVFAQQWSQRCAPAEIEQVAPPRVINRAVAYWEKYTELCGGREQQNVQAEIERMYAVIFEDFDSRQ